MSNLYNIRIKVQQNQIMFIITDQQTFIVPNQYPYIISANKTLSIRNANGQLNWLANKNLTETRNQIPAICSKTIISGTKSVNNTIRYVK